LHCSIMNTQNTMRKEKVRNDTHTSINTRTASTRWKPLQCLNNTRRTILISGSEPEIIIRPQVQTPRYLRCPSAQHTIIAINQENAPKESPSNNGKSYFLSVFTSKSCYCHWRNAGQHQTTRPEHSKSDVQNNPKH
jgi:hypothetical protein